MEPDGFPAHPKSAGHVGLQIVDKNAFFVLQPRLFEEGVKAARVRLGGAVFRGNHYPSEMFEERIFFPKDPEIFPRGIGQSVKLESGRFQSADGILAFARWTRDSRSEEDQNRKPDCSRVRKIWPGRGYQ
jgi:hypothetical protein